MAGLTPMSKVAVTWWARLPDVAQEELARLVLLELSDLEQPAHPTRRLAIERNQTIPFRQSA